MPSKRNYKLKATNDYLVLSAIFFFLCLWAVKDAWYPSEKVMKKHPQQIVAAFETAGAVEKILVEEGESLGEGQVIAVLRRDRMNVEYEASKSAYTVAKKKNSMMQLALKNAEKNGASEEGVVEIKESLAEARSAMDASLKTVAELKARVDAAELKSPAKGSVLEIKAASHSMVEAGDAVIIIDPKDHFYLFNKSLAIFSFLAFWVFLAVHVLAR